MAADECLLASPEQRGGHEPVLILKALAFSLCFIETTS